MDKNEFKRAFQVAQQRKADQVDFDHESIALFHGYGLSDYKPVACTIEAVADLIRYQASCLDGSWDAKELNTLAHIARRKFTIIN